MQHTQRTADALVESAEPSLLGKRNRPLGFTLKHIDVEHPALDRLGVRRETLRAFGVGFYAGKGVMHGKVVIPFHNAEGLLVAYAGYSTKDGSISYPKKFDPRLEVFNYWRCENSGLFEDGIVLVTDLLNVLRLCELGVHRVVALPTETLHASQLAQICRLVGSSRQVDFVPWTPEYVDILAALLPHFHVRLHRYYEGGDDELLSQVVHSIGW